MEFDGENGYWDVGTEGYLFCSCAGGNLGYSGESPLDLGSAQVPTYMSIVGTPAYTQGPPAPYAYNINRQILDQDHHPIDAVMHVHEYFDPAVPTGNCTAQAVDTHDGDSNSAGIFGPDLYSLPGNAPNPCSSSSTQHFVVTLASRQYTISTTYAVQWQYSGVTVTAQ
jgi:hypothetical protein